MKKNLDILLKFSLATAIVSSSISCARKSIEPDIISAQPTTTTATIDGITRNTITALPTIISEPTIVPTPTPRPDFDINGVMLNHPELSTNLKIALKNGQTFEINTAFITDSNPNKLGSQCLPGTHKICTYISDYQTFLYPHSGFIRDAFGFKIPLEIEAVREYIEGPLSNLHTQEEVTTRLAEFTDATFQISQNGHLATAHITSAVRIDPTHVNEFIRNWGDAPSIAAILNPEVSEKITQSKYFIQTCGNILPGEANPDKLHSYSASRLLFSLTVDDTTSPQN